MLFLRIFLTIALIHACCYWVYWVPGVLAEANRGGMVLFTTLSTLFLSMAVLFVIELWFAKKRRWDGGASSYRWRVK